MTKAPDLIESEIKGEIALQAGLGALIFVVVAIICYTAAVSFAKTLGEPIEKLAGYIKKAKHTAGLTHDIPHDTIPDNCCRELAGVFAHLDNLIVALRFGSPAWAEGRDDRELENYGRALKLVKSDRGRGVCQTMIGQTARRIINAHRLEGAWVGKNKHAGIYKKRVLCYCFFGVYCIA